MPTNSKRSRSVLRPRNAANIEAQRRHGIFEIKGNEEFILDDEGTKSDRCCIFPHNRSPMLSVVWRGRL